MPFYKNGPVSLYYEEAGSGYPLLCLPDDIPAKPYDMAMESAELAPNAQVSLYPWKEPKTRIPMAVRHVRTFLKAYRPVTDR